MNSRSFARLWKSAFVKIDEVWNALNVVAIDDSHVLFSLFETRRDRITPPELRCESVPDKEIAVVQVTTLFETPFQNFFVRPILLHTLNHIAMVHAQKIAAHAVCRFQRAEVFSIIFVEFATQMQPNLVQHAREIHHAARHFFGTLWIASHRQMNRIILWRRNIGGMLFRALPPTSGFLSFCPPIPR